MFEDALEEVPVSFTENLFWIVWLPQGCCLDQILTLVLKWNTILTKKFGSVMSSVTV